MDRSGRRTGSGFFRNNRRQMVWMRLPFIGYYTSLSHLITAFKPTERPLRGFSANAARKTMHKDLIAAVRRNDRVAIPYEGG